MIIIYALIFSLAIAMTIGNILLKVYEQQEASVVLQPIIIIVTVIW